MRCLWFFQCFSNFILSPVHDPCRHVRKKSLSTIMVDRRPVDNSPSTNKLFNVLVNVNINWIGSQTFISRLIWVSHTTLLKEVCISKCGAVIDLLESFLESGRTAPDSLVWSMDWTFLFFFFFFFCIGFESGTKWSITCLKILLCYGT